MAKVQMLKARINGTKFRVIKDTDRKNNQYVITKEVCYGHQVTVGKYADYLSCWYTLTSMVAGEEA